MEKKETERETEIWRAEGSINKKPESCLGLVHWQQQQHWPGLSEWLQEPSSAFPFLAGLYVEVTPNGRWLDELRYFWLGWGKLGFNAQCEAVSWKLVMGKSGGGGCYNGQRTWMKVKMIWVSVQKSAGDNTAAKKWWEMDIFFLSASHCGAQEVFQVHSTQWQWWKNTGNLYCYIIKRWLSLKKKKYWC